MGTAVLASVIYSLMYNGLTFNDIMSVSPLFVGVILKVEELIVSKICINKGELK